MGWSCELIRPIECGKSDLVCLLGLKRSWSFYFYPLGTPRLPSREEAGDEGQHLERERENWLEWLSQLSHQLMETEEVNFGKPLFFWRLDMQQWISDIFPTGELKLSMTKLLPLSFALSYTWLPIWKCILSLHPTSSPSQRRDIFLCQRKLILMILSAGPDSWTWLLWSHLFPDATTTLLSPPTGSSGLAFLSS